MSSIGSLSGDVGVALAALCVMAVIVGVAMAVSPRHDPTKTTNVALMFFVAFCLGAGALAPGLHLFDTARITADAFGQMALDNVFGMTWPL